MSYGSTPPPPPPPPPGSGFPPPEDGNSAGTPAWTTPTGGQLPPPPPSPGYPPVMPPDAMAPVYSAKTGTNPLAITSLVLGIVGFLCFGIILGPVAAVLGFLGRKQIAETGGSQSGSGMALAGIILGAVAFVISIIGLAVGMSGLVKLPTG